MKSTFLKKSLNRILQEIYAKGQVAKGYIVEFGAKENSKKNFVNFFKIDEMKTISFADKILEEKNVVYQDLEKKLSFKDNSIDTVIIFNVLEHVFDIDNSLEEINRVLKPRWKNYWINTIYS